MPELPDIEYFKKYFKKTSLNKKIIDIKCDSKKQIRKIVFKDFKKKLIGKSFKGAERRGKFLIVEIKGIREKLILHFGMTGELHYVLAKNVSQKDKFARLILKFENKDEIRWLNMRKFGKVYLVKNPEQIDLIKEMGPEPLLLSEKGFFKLLNQYQDKNIKAFLLNQRDIAGIGNIYSDEILFQAKINPHQQISDLKDSERKKLYQKTRKVLKKASQLQHPKARFPDSWLLAHRNTDRNCPQNKNHKLKREIIAGRAAIFCPICQK